jgi:dienelactone hydrolase
MNTPSRGAVRKVSLVAFILASAVVAFFTACSASGRAAESGATYGPFGPEAPRLREQLWIVPGGDASLPLRATVFRPAEGHDANRTTPIRHPLVVINHGSDASTRESVSMPVFFWLSKWFVDRGYVVLLPQRRGYGATGGEWAEGKDWCTNPDHYSAGVAAADDIEGALNYMAAQPFIDPSRIVVAGISTGGWASLALAARNPTSVRLVVNFAGGRGGHAYGRANAICSPERLIEAVGAYGQAARVPTLWLYAANDSYFGPDLATAMTDAWKNNGGSADLRLLPPYGSEGHAVADDKAGWRLWGSHLEDALETYVGVDGDREVPRLVSEKKQ